MHDELVEIIDEEEVNQRLERLILSGGGAKGVAYLGFYRASERYGLFKHLKIIAGASAGSIIAAFIAVGMSSDTLREILLNNNFKDLLGSPKKWINKDGKPLETLIRSQLIATVKDFLISKWNDPSLHANQDFKNLVGKFVEKEAESFSFADLAKLNTLFPDKFKQFVTLAVEIEKGGVQVFNCEDTPEVDVALACRASASLPVILKPAEIVMDGKVRKFADGGLVDNFPDYFDKNAEGWIIKNQKPTETLVMGFNEGVDTKKNPFFQVQYGKPHFKRKAKDKFYRPTRFDKFCRNKVPGFFRLKFPFKNTERKNKGFEKINKEYPPHNTIGLSVYNIGTTSFTKAEKYKLEIPALSYLDTIKHFIDYNFLGSEEGDNFYETLMRYFQHIYTILKGEDWKKNSSLGRKITALENTLKAQKIEKQIDRKTCYLLRDWVESHFESRAAFALSLAVDIHSGELNEDILQESQTILSRRR